MVSSHSFAKGDSTKYEGKILVSFTINSLKLKKSRSNNPGGSGSSSSKIQEQRTPGGQVPKSSIR
ncbi:hypothetical protein JNG57_04250 [Mycoplasmopsis bovis]|uniref:hypothetical protein n=1 Tax=Mycoplasmopsis bovis TaxID=28903 RepID=UPI001CF4E85C|nr:hypothetical protein [Mycoplasmopsis bovis]UCP05070.1 hypothetical protein JNG57_04250 [Mycoplasmopsis bovis]